MDPPVSGVSETPATIVRKERRLVFTWAGEAAARSVRIRVALLTWPVPDPFDLLGPLHDSREKAITRTEKASKFLSSRRHIPSRIDLRSRFTLPFPLQREVWPSLGAPTTGRSISRSLNSIEP